MWRSEEEMLRVVRARAAARRARRLAVATASVLAIVLVGAVSGLAVRLPDGRDQLAGPAASSTSVPVTGPAPTTPTTETSTPPPAPTTAPAVRVPPDLRPTTTAVLARCRAEDLTTRLSTAKTDYRPGEPVSGTLTVTNASPTPCVVAADSSTSVLGADGESLWGMAVALSCGPDPCGTLLQPRETDTRPTFCWNQQGIDPPGQVPPGTYTVVHRVGPIESRTTFQIVAAASTATTSSPQSC